MNQKWLYQIVSLTALLSRTLAGWSGLITVSLSGAQGQCSSLIMAMLWKITHAIIVSQSLSGMTRSPRRQWKHPFAVGWAQDQGKGVVIKYGYLPDDRAGNHI